MEEDARNKAEAANASYKQHLFATNTTRHEYYEIHLPRMITVIYKKKRFSFKKFFFEVLFT